MEVPCNGLHGAANGGPGRSHPHLRHDETRARARTAPQLAAGVSRRGAFPPGQLDRPWPSGFMGAQTRWTGRGRTAAGRVVGLAEHRRRTGAADSARAGWRGGGAAAACFPSSRGGADHDDDQDPVSPSGRSRGRRECARAHPAGLRVLGSESPRAARSPTEPNPAGGALRAEGARV